jgi:hypothetical protein
MFLFMLEFLEQFSGRCEVGDMATTKELESRVEQRERADSVIDKQSHSSDQEHDVAVTSYVILQRRSITYVTTDSNS